MKYKILGIGLSLLGLSTLSAQDYTLEQCIATALRNSPEYQNRQIRLERSRQQVERSRHNFLPTMQASLGQSWDFGRSVDKTGVMNDRSSMGASFSVGAGYTLFSGFARLHDIKASKLQVEAAVADLEQAKQDLAIQIVQYYYACLHAEGLVSAARGQWERSQAQSTYATQLYEAGRWSQDKVAQSKATEVQDEQNLQQAQHNYAEALLRLRQAMQVDSLRLIAPDEAHAFAQAREVEEQAALLGQDALQEQAALRANHYNQLAAEELVKQSRSGYMPTLSLSAGYSNNYYRILGDAFAGLNPTLGDQLRQNGRSYIGLNLSIPIFDAFRTRSQIRQAKLNLRDLQATARSIQRQVQTEFERARLASDLARRKIEASRVTIEACRSAEALALESWRAGRTSSNELSIARSRTFVAEVEHLNAKHDYLLKCQLLRYYLPHR